MQEILNFHLPSLCNSAIISMRDQPKLWNAIITSCYGFRAEIHFPFYGLPLINLRVRKTTNINNVRRSPCPDVINRCLSGSVWF